MIQLRGLHIRITYIYNEGNRRYMQTLNSDADKTVPTSFFGLARMDLLGYPKCRLRYF